MRNFIKRLAVRTRGMEALQAVLILGAAFVIIIGIKDMAGKAKTEAQTGISEAISSGSGGDSKGGSKGDTKSE